MFISARMFWVISMTLLAGVSLFFLFLPYVINDTGDFVFPVLQADSISVDNEPIHVWVLSDKLASLQATGAVRTDESAFFLKRFSFAKTEIWNIGHASILCVYGNDRSSDSSFYTILLVRKKMVNVLQRIRVDEKGRLVAERRVDWVGAGVFLSLALFAMFLLSPYNPMFSKKLSEKKILAISKTGELKEGFLISRKK